MKLKHAELCLFKPKGEKLPIIGRFIDKNKRRTNTAAVIDGVKVPAGDIFISLRKGDDRKCYPASEIELVKLLERSNKQ